MFDKDSKDSHDIKNDIKNFVVKKVVDFAGKELLKDHGSKVKKGTFEDCKITLVGTKACICLGDDEYLELTDENVRKITFVKEKHRIDHTYYYYEIKFHNGKNSYVRMRRKYRDAMYAHCSCI